MLGAWLISLLKPRTASHPNFTPWSEITWKQFVTGSRTFRPQLSFVAVLDGSDEIVAYLQTAEFDADLDATGRREAYVGRIATLPEHRGQGLGGALLGHCLQTYRNAGYAEAALNVDSENPSGALGIYERAGFKVESQWTNYFLIVVPEPGSRPHIAESETKLCMSCTVRTTIGPGRLGARRSGPAASGRTHLG